MMENAGSFSVETALVRQNSWKLSQDTSEVRRFGNAPVGFDIREVRKKIGYMSSFIKEMIYDNEQIIDVVLSGLYASTGMYDVASDKEKAYAYELLTTIHMQQRSEDIFSHLSDGEKQKVLMLRAFINKPSLLILDEPCMGLDLAARDDFLHAVESIAQTQEVSIIYVTHHIEEITSIYSKIFIINQGSCFFRGAIAEGINDHTLQTIFQKAIHVITINGKYYSILD
jgi:iron complex transport system ATP-binding protein